MNRPATIADVARLAGWSIATVSRHVNGAGKVSPEAAAAIQRSIEELGYVPSASARGLVSQQTGMIGLVLPAVRDESPVVESNNLVEYDAQTATQIAEVCHSYQNDIIRGAESAAWEIGHAITIAAVRDPEANSRVRDMASRVDGLVVVGDAVEANLLTHLARRVPVVLVDSTRHESIHDYVDSADAVGAGLLAQHLVEEHGVTQLVFVAGTSLTAVERRCFTVLERLGATLLQVSDATASEPEVVAALVQRRQDTGRLGLVCSSDELGVRVLRLAEQAGLSVPDDAAITGFDDCRIGRAAKPRLTSVRQAPLDLGALAVEALQRRLSNPQSEPQHYEVPITVVVRESCGSHSTSPPVSA
jgi:LacI family transcriptional regulator